MSRGGRGGGRGGRGGGGLNTGSKMRGQALPFNVDPEIEEQVERSRAGEEDDDPMHQELFPDIDLIPPRPPTDAERAWVKSWRETMAKRKASPWFTGECETKQSRKGDSDMPGGLNPFEDAPTWSNSKRKSKAPVPDLSRAPLLHPEFFAKELRPFIQQMKDRGKGIHDLVHLSKNPHLIEETMQDKLARFGDGEEDDEAAVDKDEAAEEEEKPADEDDDAPVDDTYEEDEDDMANDYNAEAYFDDGEVDHEEYGGDDHGDDGY